MKVAAYEQTYFTYGFHQGMTPYAPSQFNALQVGDCKDFAAFASAIDSANGYSANTYAFLYEPQTGPNVDAHVVSGVVYNGQQYFLSDGHLVGPTDMSGLLNYESTNHGTDLPFGCNPPLSSVATYDPNFLGALNPAGISTSGSSYSYGKNSNPSILAGSV
jgi:hypothetical protein